MSCTKYTVIILDNCPIQLRVVQAYLLGIELVLVVILIWLMVKRLIP